MTPKSITLHPHEVRGLLAGTLGQIRRVIEPQPDHWCLSHITGVWVNGEFHWPTYSKDIPERIFKPKYQPGDVVAVKEAWGIRGWCDDAPEVAGNHPEGLRLQIVYRDADGDEIPGRKYYPDSEGYARIRALVKCYKDECRWRSARTMPLWASRLSIPIASVRVQRVQEMSNEDAAASGILFSCTQPHSGCSCNRNAYKELWNKDNPRHPWASNPACWVFTIGKEK
jgi:hypothetical protein